MARDHVELLRITPDVRSKQVTVEPKGVRAGLPARAAAYEGGKRVAAVHGRTGEPLRLTVEKPHLWSPDDPFPHDLRVTVGGDGRGDTLRSYSGMRSLAVEKVDGIPRTVLNGAPTFLMATLDQGGRLPGARAGL